MGLNERDNKILIYQHAGSGNHGCEALLRTSYEMLQEGGEVYVASNFPQEDIAYGAITADRLIGTALPEKGSARWLGYKINDCIIHSNLIRENCFYDKKVVKASEHFNVAVAIGGDNYCYNQGKAFWSTDCKIRKNVKKMVLWGASLEPDDIEGAFAEHLKLFDLIIARESITYNKLQSVGLPVVLSPDGAFTLKKAENCKLPPELRQDTAHKWIGVNLSPMVEQKKPGLARQNYRRLVETILEETDANVVLIPHVIWGTSDDRKSLTALYNEVGNNKRVFLIEDQNCCQLKNIISRCEFFVGSRTHATIAAYSTCVPTLVAGYSVKARGIAKDLFGDWKDYVVPVQTLKQPDDLLTAYKKLFKKRDKIQAHLQSVMPEYINKAAEAKEEFAKVIK